MKILRTYEPDMEAQIRALGLLLGQQAVLTTPGRMGKADHGPTSPEGSNAKAAACQGLSLGQGMKDRLVRSDERQFKHKGLGVLGGETEATRLEKSHLGAITHEEIIQ